MTHNELFAELKTGKIQKCYLFEGEEEFVKRSALKRLKELALNASFADMNDTRLTDPDADALIAAAETLPFMDEMRVVTVYESGMLTGKAGDYDESKAADRLKEYIPNIPDSTCIVFFVRGKADGRKKLYTALKKLAVIVSFERLTDKELNAWIAKECKKYGKQIAQTDCERLIFLAGKDLNMLSNEIAKMCDYQTDSDTVQTEAILKLCTQTVEYKVFDMAGLLLDGEGRKAFDLLNGLLRDGEERIYLLALLGRQCRQLQAVRRLTNKKYQNAEIARQTGIPAFVVQKTITQAQKYTEQQLDEMVELCAKTEYEIKSGMIADEGSLESLMLRILSIRKGS